MRRATTSTWIRLITLAFSGWCLAAPALAQTPSFTVFDPLAAEPGESVTLHGTGFDLLVTYTVRVSNVVAVVEEVQTDFLRFTVPVGAVTAPVEVEVGAAGPVLSTARALKVLRSLVADMDPALAAATSGYLFGTIYGDAPPGGPSFPVRVVQGEPTLVAAVRNPEDSNLLAIAIDTTAGVTVSAASTAAALVFLTPQGFDGDPAQDDLILTTIAGLVETQALASLIETAVLAGEDYGESPGFDATYLSAVLAYVAAAPPPPAAVPGGATEAVILNDYVGELVGFSNNSPRDLFKNTDLDLPDLDRMGHTATTETENDEHGVPAHGLSFPARSNGNPLDWIIHLYEVIPDRFAGRPQFENLLNDNTVYSDERRGKISTLHVSATLNSKKIDLIGQLKGWLTTQVFPPAKLRIPAERSALFLARGFSGADFDSQDALINAIPNRQSEANIAAALNISLAVIDGLGIFINAADFVGDNEIAGIILSVQFGIAKALDSQAAAGNLDASLLRAVYEEAVKVGISMIVDAIKKKGILSVFSALGKTALKVVDIPGKVAAVGAVIERVTALTNVFGSPTLNVAQAVETTTISMGDPWSPVITSFLPRQGYIGTTVTIHGRGFSRIPGENIVEFNIPLGTDPANQPAVAKAIVLKDSATSLVVEIPGGSPTGVGFITVRRAGRGGSSTVGLPPPNSTFRVIPDPVILSLSPDPPVAGTIFTIVGENFSRERARNQVWVDDIFRTPISATETKIRYRSINTTAPVNLKVEIKHDTDAAKSRFSNVVQVTAAAPVGGNPGTVFNVLTLAEGDVMDGQVTLREAMGWANGTLARAPTLRPQGTTTGSFESDFINPSNFVAGAHNEFSKDTIAADGLPPGSVLFLSGGQLPDVKNFDQFFFGNLTLDGTSATGDGLTLSGEKALVRDLLLRNIAGHGVRFVNAKANQLKFVQVDGCGGSGLRMEGTSSANNFDTLSAENCTEHGVHLLGPGVSANEFFFRVNPAGSLAGSISDNDMYGVLVEGGAQANLLHVGDIRRNTMGGVRIQGSASTDNYLGSPDLSAPPFPWMEVSGSIGDGIWSEASRTSVRFVRVTGSQGDGIVLTGTGHTDSQLASNSIGIDGNGAAAKNTGSGIHIIGDVSDVLVGSEPSVGFNQGPPNEIAANDVHGIWLDGPAVHNIRIKDTRIGAPFENTTFPIPAILPNGMHGIAITGGAHDNEIGESDTKFSVEVVGHAGGSGIHMSGSGTRGNIVLGSYIGNLYRQELWDWTTGLALGNLHGIRITGGAHSNLIGRPGTWVTVFDEFDLLVYEKDPVNYIVTNLEAGLLLESGGDSGSILPGQTPSGGNVLENNYVDGNGTGLILRTGARANRIGSPISGEGNTFFGNTKAGIHIDAVNITEPNLSNRIVGNRVQGHQGTFVPNDILTQPPDGVGILVTNSSGHRIGGETQINNLVFGNRVGVYIQNSTDIVLTSNRLGHQSLGSNDLAGLILSSSTNCVVGPNNQVLGNGRSVAGAVGGIAVYGNGGHRIFGNFIGTRPDGSAILGNGPYGIYLKDSSGNHIGSRETSGANIIVDSQGDGVRIEGASTGNQVAANAIGQVTPTLAISPNLGAGVRLLAGATGNVVGGELKIDVGGTEVLLPAGNTIIGNLQPGVIVDGATTLKNEIRNNSITAHPGLGIDTSNGGNGEPIPPVLTSVAGGKVLGTVDPTIPDGSRVQIFSDSGDEGEILMSRAVVIGGSFSAPLGLVGGNQLHATVTHTATGATSEFGGVLNLSSVLDIAKRTDITVPSQAPAGLKDQVVLPLVLEAVGLPARVLSMRVDTSGTLLDDSGVLGVRIYEDVDGDGTVTQRDTLLGGPVPFPADDGFVDLPLTNATVSTFVRRNWLVTYDLSANAAQGATFQAAVVATTSVAADLALVPGSPVIASGLFPILSDQVTVAAAPMTPSVLTVSADPLDWADYTTIQAAVDAVNQAGVEIQILPGPLGVYHENVVLDGVLDLTLKGSGGTIIDGDLGAAVTILSTLLGSPATLEDLTLRGANGVHALAPTVLRNVDFEMIAGTALDLDAGHHEVLGSTMDSTVVNGINLAPGVRLTARQVQLLGLSGTAAVLGGDAVLVNALVVGTGNGLVLGAGGSLDLRHSTLADGLGLGVDNLAGRPVSIHSSIVWNHGGGDLAGMICTDVTWSDVGSPDCSSVGDNLAVVPGFLVPGTDYHLMPGSPLLDHGDDLAAFTGDPCIDLDGNLRARDHDGDGLTRIDPGAYEWEDLLRTPGEVTGLTWTDTTTLTWVAAPGALSYHLYIGDAASLGYGSMGICEDLLDPDLTDTLWVDPGPPPGPAQLQFFLVTGDDGILEGTGGPGTCAERSNPAQCP